MTRATAKITFRAPAGDPFPVMIAGVTLPRVTASLYVMQFELPAALRRHQTMLQISKVVYSQREGTRLL